MRNEKIFLQLNEKKTALDVAEKNESTVKEKFGKQSGREVLRLVERVLTNHCISKPYYHGGKYNGKAMNKFMTSSQEIMDDLSTMLQQLPPENRCPDAEVAEVTSKFKSVFHVFGFIFSKAQKASGLVMENDVQELNDYIYLGIKLWRNLDLSMEAPKPHAMEDHLCDQMLWLNGIGDLGEDFVEKAHQDGIRDEGRSRSIKDRGAAAILHCKWEQKRNLPQVLSKSEEVQQKSIRTKKARTDSGQAAVAVVSKRNEKLQLVQARTAAFLSISSSNEVFITTGRKRNLQHYIESIISARSLINRQIRILLAKISTEKKRRPIIIIQMQL
jgi:hypothetical protein